ncbi:MAG: NADH-ubiquinone oxidoreductase-F iron-sulfur binding region domain-containing protein [Candidatus Heimdallarchaeaceae archaeon]
MTKAINTINLEDIATKEVERLYPKKPKIVVSKSTCGLASGAAKIYETIQKEINNLNLDWILTETGCIGFCQIEPLIYFYQPGKPKLFYGNLTEKKTSELVQALAEGDLKKDWILWKIEDEENIITETKFSLGIDDDLEDIVHYDKYPFFSKQRKIVLRNCGFIDPNSIEEYIVKGGYSALTKVLNDYKPQEVIDIVKKSGLRGRGGAGFPTGVKWELCSKEESDIRYIICNADEGDPGAYMNRSVLEGDPHSVIEGMIIGAYAIGSSEGYIYVRAEYPLAIEKLKEAIIQAEEHGFLGENILDSGFSLRISIVKGAGAFVCGEETALIASIEGRPVDPRMRPPFPSKSGLWDKPTNINNVETWNNVPVIIARGHEWYSSLGTENSKGTKVFSLVGKIKNTGLVEVPMGITLREIIYDIGGGILENKKFKAIQTGGPSGGCLHEKHIDLPVDYDSLVKVGSIMGSGGMIVVDEETCIVDLAKFFIDFTRDESCGTCSSCREGLDAYYEILTRVTEGKALVSELDLLEELGQTIIDFSLCGLGKTAPNPVLTTLKYFRDEYVEHIEEKKCRAKVCKALIEFTIVSESCTGCEACAKLCPQEAITGEPKKPHKIDPELCVQCGICFDTCRFDAITISTGGKV